MPHEQSDKQSCVRGYIDGCFDIMHSGHYNAIRQAKGLCDTLVVGIHSDSEIEENKALPVMQQSERYGLLHHVKWIDEIVHDVPYSPLLETLDKAHADFCVHGDDMPINSQGVCAYDEMKNAGRLRIIQRTEGISTTDIIGRLITLAHQLQLPTSDIQNVQISELESRARKLSESSPSPQVESSPLPMECIELVKDLASRYNMTAEDAQKITDSFQLVACQHNTIESLAPPNDSSCATGSVSNQHSYQVQHESVRTRVPVQLLASTRRILEFASSKQPLKNDRIVYVSGSFDMFHVGHAQFLKDAKSLGTFLLVGIYDDMSVFQAKGVGFPVMSLNERVLNVSACKWVDEIIIGAPRHVTEDLIKTWGITAVARGTGHKRNEPLDPASDNFMVPKTLGIFAEVQSQWPDLCHETIVARIVKSRELYMKRNKDRAQREDAYYTNKKPEQIR